MSLLYAGCARHSNFLQLLTVEQCFGVAVAVAVQYKIILKGLGHAILGNFSIDQMVIELTELTKEWLKTTEELKQNTGKLRRDKDGQNWGGMKWIAFL